MFYEPKYLGQSYSDPREQYRIPGRHTSVIDNGYLVQSPYAFDQDRVANNQAALDQAGMARSFGEPEQPMDPVESFAARYRPTTSYRDLLAGKTQAGTAGLKFIDDPQFRNLTPEQQNTISQRVTGRTLDQQLQADSMIGSGAPMTWQDIESRQARLANQKAAFAQLRGIEQYGGVRDVGTLLREYDPNTQSYSYDTGKLDVLGKPIMRTMDYAPEEIAAIRRVYDSAGLPAIPGKSMNPQPAPQPSNLETEMRRRRWMELQAKRKATAEYDQRQMSEADADAILNWRFFGNKPASAPQVSESWPYPM